VGGVWWLVGGGLLPRLWLWRGGDGGFRSNTEVNSVEDIGTGCCMNFDGFAFGKKTRVNENSISH
jgi:hypothetical protein